MAKKSSVLNDVRKTRPESSDVRVLLIFFGAVIIMLFSSCSIYKYSTPAGQVLANCLSPNVTTGFFSGYGAGSTLGSMDNINVDNWNAQVNNVSQGCCLPGSCYYNNFAGSSRCYIVGDSFTNDVGRMNCMANGSLVRWCRNGSVLDSKGNCLGKMRSAELFEFGSYKGEADLSICGDNPGEYPVQDGSGFKCCRFPKSVIKNGLCIQKDGRIEGKYLNMSIYYTINDTVNCTNPVLQTYDSSKSTFKDDPYQPANGFTANLVDATGSILDSYVFPFDSSGDADFSSSCLDYDADGNSIFNLDRCPYAQTAIITLPCFSGAAKIRILNETGGLICEKNVGGMC